MGNDALGLVVSLNLKRRHLSESQRAMVAANIANLPAHRPTDNSANWQTSQEHAAELLNVSTRTVARAAKVKQQGAPELIHAVQSGQVSVSAAADIATLPKLEQQQIVARGKKEILAASKAFRSADTEEKRAIENQYPTMTHEELCALPVAEAALSVLALPPRYPRIEKRVGR